jgi:16S rRNA (uracil1498-N3)-methyltransferase
MADHRRFFVDPECIGEGDAVVEGAVARQISKVLRLRAGDSITLLDGLGSAYPARITAISTGRVSAQILGKQSGVNEPTVKIVVASCLPKGDRAEFIVQKCTELGVAQIALVCSERTVARPDDNRDKKLARLRRIAREAAEQCGRSQAPDVRGVMDFGELVEMVRQFPLAIVAWEEQDGSSLKKALTDRAGVESMLIIIGPEGGLTDNEVEALKSAGAVPVSLGPRLLRTDTAAITACAAVMYEIEGEL